MTTVYVEGYCFGDSIGSVTVGGVQVTKFKFWKDYEIAFTLPYNATSGNLVVTSQSYGSDSSEKEAVCCGDACSDGENWPFDTQQCGNDTINAAFWVDSPQSPSFIKTSGTWGTQNCTTSEPCLKVDGSPSAPQYVDGSWYFSNGGEVAIFTLTQGAENSSGISTVTGTEWDNVNGGPNPIQAGQMDEHGDVVIRDNQTGDCLEFQILNSGDVTAPGLEQPSDPSCPVPEQNFFTSDYYESEEGPFYFYVKPPLFKTQNDVPPFVSQTDVPAIETPESNGWIIPQGSKSQYETYGVWWRTDLGEPDMNGMFESRFVYEQSGGAATDGCYAAFPNSTYLQVASVTSGGGWFLNQSDQWGTDLIGMESQAVSFYQQYYAIPYAKDCKITGPQAMYIDARTQPVTVPFEPYTTNTLMTADITSSSLTTGVQSSGSTMVKECEPYSYKSGVEHGKCH